MQRGTDIQNFIPHLPLSPACMLSPLITAFSGSKSHFGPASVLVEKKPVAVALIVVVNPNLNCGDIPLATGYVIAPNTVVTGLTLGDFLGGLFAMFVDTAIQTLMNKILPGPGGALIGTLLGSPLGFSANANGKGIVGVVGRAEQNLSDWARSWGESLGGDSAQGEADRKEAVKAGDKTNKELLEDPLDWNVLGRPATPAAPAKDGKPAKEAEDAKDGDLKRLTPNPLFNPFTPLQGAFDNPAAEQF
jgi:hypothetical protein